MINRIRNDIVKNNLIENEDKIVIGVSGGVDSMVLLHVLYDLKKYMNFDLICCHINHGTRNRMSDVDAKFVEEHCNGLGIRCYVYSYILSEEATKLKMSQEEAGRFLRYNAFRQVLKKENANKIATAHNLNDNVETVLMNIIRGTGINGLCGIRIKGHDIIRPLLNISKDEIRKHASCNNIPYHEDYTNAEVEYTRNKIRNDIIPYIMKNINEGFMNTSSTMISNLKEDNDFLEELARDAYDRLNIEEDKKEQKQEQDISINMNDNSLKFNDSKKVMLTVKISSLISEPKVIQKRVIRDMIKNVNNGSLKDIGNVYLNMILDLIKSGTGKMCNLPFGIKAETSYDILKIYKDDYQKKYQNQNESEDTNEILIDLSKLEINKLYETYNKFKNIKICYKLINKNDVNINDIKNNKCIEIFNVDNVDNIILRNRKKGDTISYTKDGKRKKVKDIFIDAKVEKNERENVVLVVNKKENDVMAVMEYKWNPNYEIFPSTKMAFYVEIIHLT